MGEEIIFNVFYYFNPDVVGFEIIKIRNKEIQRKWNKKYILNEM